MHDTRLTRVTCDPRVTQYSRAKSMCPYGEQPNKTLNNCKYHYIISCLKTSINFNFFTWTYLYCVEKGNSLHSWTKLRQRMRGIRFRHMTVILTFDWLITMKPTSWLAGDYYVTIMVSFNWLSLVTHAIWLAASCHVTIILSFDWLQGVTWH